MSTGGFGPGAIVEIPVGRGKLRYSGTTHFAKGQWVGIELFEPKGKNDGSIEGERYFNCTMPYGVFVRPSQVKLISPGEENGLPFYSFVLFKAAPVTVVRPAAGHVRSSSSGRVLANAARSPVPGSPSPAGSRSDSPRGRPKITPATPATPAIASPIRTRPVGALSPTKRSSLAPPALITRPNQTRQRTGTGESIPPTPVTATMKQRLAEPKRTESPTSLSPSTSQQTSSPPIPPINFDQPESGPESEQEIQEIKAKIRVLEAKRSDDARVIEKLESQLSEVNHFVALRPKLQQKLATLQQELIANRRALADAEQVQTLGESRLLDAQEQLELAMLDKEVAEERAETAELELVSLQERVESLEVELETLRGGGQGGEVDDSVKSSLAYAQLEKHNDRLKEALIRLRDQSRETEQEQRHRIAELERELNTLEEMSSQYESTLGKLSNADNQIDELKAQLDDALGAEEMLEQLTERNLVLGEKIAEMTITIEDLEALKELNDELEENHVETEKQLNEEITQKETQIREQVRKIAELEGACQDFEGTINQFRDLVMQLQTELDTLRMQTQTAQNESATAASQTAAMMSLNMKLQSSASKHQARNIEIELARIQARETKDLYEIVKPYLPQVYIDSDSEATQCYLYFQRMAAKADLINTAVAQSHGLPEALNGHVTEGLVRTCELRARISRMSILCKRFASILKRCDVETFLNIGRLYADVAHFEKRIDLHIDMLCRDEFRDIECVNDVQRTAQAFGHLVEMYSEGFDFDLGERELGYAQSFDHELDNLSASLALISSNISDIMKDEDVTVESDDDPEVELIQPFKRVLDQVKGTKVMSKRLTKRLEELTQDSAALKPHLIPQLEALGKKVPELVDFGITLAHSILPHFSTIQNDKGTLHTKTVLEFVKQNAIALSPDQKDVSPWDIISDAIKKLTQEAAAVVPLALEPENIVKISATPPWVVRIEEVKASLAINVEAERKVAQLSEEIQGLARGIRSRDQTIQESSVKIELMERRMDAVKKQADTITNLEAEIAKARKQERSYEDAIEQLQSDLDALEQDNAKLKQLTAGMERQRTFGPQQQETELVSAESNLETSYLLEQIEALRGAVRYLRRENSYLKGQDLLKEIQALPPLPDFSSRSTTPELDPSGSASESDSDSEVPQPPSLRSLATETSILYRDVLTFSSTPRVVDLSMINKKRMDAMNHERSWLPKRLMPSYQLLQRKQAAEELSRRVKGLMKRANSIGVTY
ncbi:dynactin [Fomitiporia mediterranea MF3/22]|uniref:dynactin n=1 Tax=Fomitiporia mediterranea (strain MF3/22) TaxID=694068 RepID=UPI00044075A8|nr:dynactin [Fomitiporia mediterranea MF3/22]EJD03547.1 dynactin [Fomitiporia mediterranea MF3/22]